MRVRACVQAGAYGPVPSGRTKSAMLLRDNCNSVSGGNSLIPRRLPSTSSPSTWLSAPLRWSSIHGCTELAEGVNPRSADITSLACVCETECASMSVRMYNARVRVDEGAWFLLLPHPARGPIQWRASGLGFRLGCRWRSCAGLWAGEQGFGGRGGRTEKRQHACARARQTHAQP